MTAPIEAPDPLVVENFPLTGVSGGHISLTVHAHQVVSFIGDAVTGVNGLAPRALGLEQTATGRVLIFGQDVQRMSRRAALAFRRQVGYVPANDGLLQNLSLADNVALPLRFGSSLSPREIDGRLRIMLAAVRLREGAATLRPADADEEQRRRASLARALAFDPDLVIMDHPFDGLGSRAASEVLEIARGGETAEGARRAVFITGQDLPDRLRSRIDVRHRIVRGELRTEPAPDST